jgi:hypothetical protein
MSHFIDLAKRSRSFRALLLRRGRNMNFASMFSSLLAALPTIREKCSGDAEVEMVNILSHGFYQVFPTVEDQHRHFFEIILTRYVDSFEYYVTQVLAAVFRLRPDTLMTSETITLREVWDIRDIDGVINWAAERRVLKLSFGGFAVMIEYLRKELGLSFPDESPALKMASEYVEVRNIIVHNDSKVSSRFHARTKRTDLPLGTRFPLTLDYLAQGAEALFQIAVNLDTAVLDHFKLKPDKVHDGSGYVSCADDERDDEWIAKLNGVTLLA